MCDNQTAFTEQSQRETDRPPLPYSVLGPASVLYAIFYTFCLYKNTSGITYPFFIAGTLLYFFFCLKKSRVPSGSRGNTAGGEAEGPKENGSATVSAEGKSGKAEIGFYTVSILLLGISVCLTDDWKLLWMTKTGIFLLTVSLALRLFYRTKGWSFAGFLRAIIRSLLEIFHYIDTPVADAVLFFRKKNERGKNGNLKYVLLGIVIAVPLLTVILALLMSADEVFSNLFQKLLGDIHPGTIAMIFLMMLAVYFYMYSFVRGLLTCRMPDRRAKEKNGEPVAAITFTGLAALIYLVFCTIQVIYLFMGKMQLPEGLTWANYARQGFFQLLFVCLINLVMVLVCLALFQESKVLKVILTAISLMTYILIASSAYRMILYIQNYYLTFLRLLVLWSLAVIAIAFAGVIVSIYKSSFPLFGYCTVIVTICYIVLAFAKPDYWIAKYDLEHAALTASEESGDTKAEERSYEDYWYLGELSADAAVLLTQEEVRDAWGDTMTMSHYYDRVWTRSEDITLRSFNFSRWAAKKSMEDWY